MRLAIFTFVMIITCAYFAVAKNVMIQATELNYTVERSQNMKKGRSPAIDYKETRTRRTLNLDK